jgi:hypothetical protein
VSICLADLAFVALGQREFESQIIPLEISSGDDVFCGLCW